MVYTGQLPIQLPWEIPIIGSKGILGGWLPRSVVVLVLVPETFSGLVNCRSSNSLFVQDEKRSAATTKAEKTAFIIEGVFFFILPSIFKVKLLNDYYDLRTGEKYA